LRAFFGDDQNKLEEFRDALKTILKKCDESMEFLHNRINNDSTDPGDLYCKAALMLSGDGAGDARTLLGHIGSMAMDERTAHAMMAQTKWRLDSACWLATRFPQSSTLEQFGAYLEDQRSAAQRAKNILTGRPIEEEDFGKLDAGLRGLQSLNVLSYEPEEKNITPPKRRSPRKLSPPKDDDNG
jgi:hypothetical protein